LRDALSWTLAATHTPGHTGESTSFVLNDPPPSLPVTPSSLTAWAVPDLHADAEAARERAGVLFHSLVRLRGLPSATLVLPAHASEPIAFDGRPIAVWYVRLGVILENAHRHLTKNPFRTFVHPAARMEELIRSAGFERSTRRETWMWSVDVYTRTGGRPVERRKD